HRVRGFAWLYVLFGAATWLDSAYCNGRCVRATVQMFTEMALHMKLIGRSRQSCGCAGKGLPARLALRVSFALTPRLSLSETVPARQSQKRDTASSYHNETVSLSGGDAPHGSTD